MLCPYGALPPAHLDSDGTSNKEAGLSFTVLSLGGMKQCLTYAILLGQITLLLGPTFCILR